MADLYRDKWIHLTEDALLIDWYYLWGRKRIPYTEIRAARQVSLRPFRGRARIWGTANPRYWAGFDPGRPRKQAALILDLGAAVSPLITPDDVPAVARILKERAGLTEIPESGDAPVM